MKRVEWIKRKYPGFIGDQVFVANATRHSIESWKRLNDYLLEEVDEFGVSTDDKLG